ncbi:Cuticle collagen sqt-1 [Aphelenchoides besseyi]|nr:Cuticle collagen sqt-1 [Aphelenchoides besseyi]
MDLKTSVTTAASLAGVALLALAVGLPMMLNEMTLLETEMAAQRQVYIDMSNAMWTDLMDQNREIRVARSASFPEIVRQRRQYGDASTNPSAASGGAPKATNNPKCPQGPKGAPGQPGEPGMDGMDGMNGVPGNGAGPTDNPYGQPEDHPCSAPCPAGPPGLPGYKGKRGPRGEKKEPKSDEGPEGELGLIGDQGPNGEKGPNGEDAIGGGRGPPGPKGPIGEPGLEGDQGPDGEAGRRVQLENKEKKEKTELLERPVTPVIWGADQDYCPCPSRSDNSPAPSVAASNDENPGYGPSAGSAAAVPSSSSAAPASSAVPAQNAAPSQGTAHSASLPAESAAPVVDTKPAANAQNQYESPVAATSSAPAEAKPSSAAPAGGAEGESGYQQAVASRRFAAYSKLAHAASLRRRHL